MNPIRHNYLFEQTYGETKTKLSFLKAKRRGQSIKDQVTKEENQQWALLDMRETQERRRNGIGSMWNVLSRKVKTTFSGFTRPNQSRA
jgi:hypothetical protein